MPPSSDPEPLVRRPRHGTRWQTLAAGIAFTLVVIAAAWTSPRILQNIDGRVYDTFLRSSPHSPAGAVPVVVDIDEESLARYGQWPWPRYRIAQLLERVRDLGAAAVALDVVFAEPDRTSLTLIAREIERDLGVAVSLGESAGQTGDNDRRLVNVLENGPFVLGYAFDFGSGPGADAGKAPGTCLLHPLARGPAVAGGTAHPVRAPQVVCNLPQLARAAGASGFFNVAPDPDGTLRSVPLLIEYRGELYPSLALAALMRARGETAVTLDSATGAARIISVAGHGYDYFSAAAVLEGRVPAAALADRIAFVGTTAAGLKELRATPFDPVYPGPEMHAAALDTLLQGDFLQKPRAAHGWELLTALLAGSLATLVLSRSGAIAGLPLLLLGSAFLWGGSFWLLSREGLFVSPLIPQSVLAGTFALLSFLRFRQSEREAAALSRKLALTQDVIIQSMAARAETRDSGTGGHIRRTRHYVKLLAELLRTHPRFRDFLDPWTIELLFKLAPLHDIGKVGVRDQVLLKPDRLSSAEFEEMKRHAIFGDNTLVSRRKYKEPLAHEQAAAILAQGRGTHFDPEMLDAFIAHQDEFRAIAARFSDASRAEGQLSV